MMRDTLYSLFLNCSLLLCYAVVSYALFVRSLSNGKTPSIAAIAATGNVEYYNSDYGRCRP